MGEKFLEQYRKRGETDRQLPENERQRGRNVHFVFSFSRHEIPDKDESGMSMDKITAEGLTHAEEVGKGDTEMPFVMITGSKSAKRARETGSAYKKGLDANGLADVINKSADAGGVEFGVYAFADQNPVAEAAKILKPILAEGKEYVKSGELKPEDLEAWAINRYMMTPDSEFKKAGVATPRETAMELAHRLGQGLQMSARLFEGLDTKVKNFTHGPKLEALLKFILVQENGKVGFDDLNEIGGAFKPGEAMDFVIDRDEKGELKSIKVKFRGKEYAIKMSVVDRLIEDFYTKTERGKQLRANQTTTKK